MGGHAPHGQHNASDARFVACPGKAEGRKEAERPPALQAPPRPHSRRKRRTPPPPPSQPLSAVPCRLRDGVSTLGHPTGKGCTNASTGRGGLSSPVLPPNRQIGNPAGHPQLKGAAAGDPTVRRSLLFHPARQSAIRRCLCPPPAPVHVSRRSGGATVRLLPLCTSVGDPTVPHPTQPPPPLSRPRTRRLGPPGTRNTLHNAQPHPRDWIHSRRHP